MSNETKGPQLPAEAQAQGGGGVEYEFEVWQNDSLQAGGSTSDYATAKSEADHYALMYGQDGPVEVRMYEKRHITTPPSAPVGDSLLQTALRNLPQYISKSGLVGPDMHSAMQCFEVLRDALAQQPAPVAPVGVEEIVDRLATDRDYSRGEAVDDLRRALYTPERRASQ